MITKESTFNFQPLMFYTSSGFTSDNQTYYENQLEKPLVYVDSTNLIPFQLLKTSNITDVMTSAYLVDYLTGKQTSILSSISTNVVVNASLIKGYITYDGSSTVNADYGTYYLLISDGTTTWKSEIFCIVDTSNEDFLKIKYSSNYDNFDFIFQTGFEFWIFIKSGINTEPDIVKETFITNENNENYKIEDIRNPRYSFSLLAKDWLFRALSIMAQCENIEITTSNGLTKQTFNAENLEIELSNLEMFYYKLKIKFGIINDTSIKRVNNQDNIILETRVLLNEDGSGDHILMDNGSDWAL